MAQQSPTQKSPVATQAAPTRAAAAVNEERALEIAIKPWKGDFQQMLDAKRIRVLVPYGRTLYFNDKGSERGLTVETVRDFERYINKKYVKDGRPVTVYGDGEQSRDFTFVANVVAANLAAGTADGAAGNVLNVATGGSETVNALADTIGRLLGCGVEKRFEPARAGDVEQSWADVSAASTVLGYRASVGFEEGLRRTIDSLSGKD